MATLSNRFDKRSHGHSLQSGRARLSAILGWDCAAVRRVGCPVSQEFGELLGLCSYLRNRGRLDQGSIADWPNRE